MIYIYIYTHLSLYIYTVHTYTYKHMQIRMYMYMYIHPSRAIVWHPTIWQTVNCQNKQLHNRNSKSLQCVRVPLLETPWGAGEKWNRNSHSSCLNETKPPPLLPRSTKKRCCCSPAFWTVSGAQLARRSAARPMATRGGRQILNQGCPMEAGPRTSKYRSHH